MGNTLCKYENDESNCNIYFSSIRNEAKVKKGENLNLRKSKILLEKAEKSICEIIADERRGTGFFVKLNILIILVKFIV